MSPVLATVCLIFHDLDSGRYVAAEMILHIPQVSSHGAKVQSYSKLFRSHDLLLSE